ncbi:MAG: hypothetical protein WA614_10540 [Acidimicrobiales bacterium]
MEDLTWTLDLLVLGMQAPEELSTIATNALVEGFDSDSLRELAGMLPSQYQSARDLFLSVMRELDIPIPTEDQARWNAVRHWALDMVEGRLDPRAASGLIHWDGWNELDQPKTLAVFAELEDEWDEHEARRPENEQTMIEAARNLLDQMDSQRKEIELARPVGIELTTEGL